MSFLAELLDFLAGGLEIAARVLEDLLRFLAEILQDRLDLVFLVVVQLQGLLDLFVPVGIRAPNLQLDFLKALELFGLEDFVDFLHGFIVNLLAQLPEFLAALVLWELEDFAKLVLVFGADFLDGFARFFNLFFTELEFFLNALVFEERRPAEAAAKAAALSNHEADEKGGNRNRQSQSSERSHSQSSLGRFSGLQAFRNGLSVNSTRITRCMGFGRSHSPGGRDLQGTPCTETDAGINPDGN